MPRFVVFDSDGALLSLCSADAGQFKFCAKHQEGTASPSPRLYKHHPLPAMGTYGNDANTNLSPSLMSWGCLGPL